MEKSIKTTFSRIMKYGPLRKQSAAETNGKQTNKQVEFDISQ
jgi:hypothetical protein